MWIKEIVEDLVRKYSTNNPFEIAAAKNIHVIERDMHEEICGFYKYMRRNKLIFLNSNLNERDKFFTCAHELGHSELHPRLSTPFLKRKTFFSINKIEAEANRFAVELLMPDETVYKYKNSFLAFDEIASIHGVPNEVAHLKRLNNIN
ncbi:ImmA/IrrE family metallo-endopeptidase [Sporosarcina sp. FSL K6-1508]|uniref:ImmA/IrrE family metallo-endopeptidase n=1 Tax=Sporosarcina sp. FSL K6-1508 TaxID=2921553 RepID=UPI0030F5ECFF